MALVELKGTVRPGTGKAAVGRLRAAQEVPAIVYGGPGGPVPVAVKWKDLMSLLATTGGNQIIRLALAGGDGLAERTVLLKDVQMDPVRGGPLHVDFLEIAMDRKIRVEVPLVLEGQAIGKGKGGLVESHLRKVVVECLPSAMPEAIRVDISGLDLGDGLHVRDLPVPEGARVLGDSGRAVVSVTIPAAEEEVAPAAAEAAPAEPEVLTKREGKEEAAAAPAEEKGKKEKEPEKKGKEKEPEKAEKPKA